MKKLIIPMLLLLCVSFANAQEFKISAEIRPRLEVRNGFKTLGSPGQDAAVFVSQRSRLKFDFQNKDEKVKFGLTLNNFRVWGDVHTLSKTDINGSAVHEAWGEILLDDHFALKAGRQELNYDDQRIFGAVNWVQQARSHDALVAKYRKGNHKLDLGLALNANSESLFEQDYTVNSYKDFQYLWYNTQLSDGLKLSVLALNNGLPFYNENDEQETAYSQTIGPRLVYKEDKFGADLAFYYQTGKIAETDLNALYFGANLNYKLSSEWGIKVGAEYLSGTDMNSTDGELKSFSPFYGTNHKFNGLMDYFYVGNHGNSVGLTDIYGSINFKKNKFSAAVMPHFFMAPGVVVDASGAEMDSGLGTEVDIVAAYKLTKSVVIKSGYSKMFATETMERLKSGSADEANHWFWFMFAIQPELFRYKKDK